MTMNERRIINAIKRAAKKRPTNLTKAEIAQLYDGEREDVAGRPLTGTPLERRIQRRVVSPHGNSG